MANAIRDQKGAPAEIGQRKERLNSRVLDGDNVLERAVGGVTGDLPRPQLAPAADPPQHVPQRYVLHHVSRRDERRDCSAW